jgi:hypothetical protein
MTKNFPCLICILALMASPLSAQQKTAAQDYLYPIELDGKIGFIDRTGTIVLTPQYTVDRNRPLRFNEGLAPVIVDGKWSYIDKTGNVVIRTPFDSAGPFGEGRACVGVKVKGKRPREVHFKYGYIDKTGTLVVEPQYDEAYWFSDGLARVVVAGKSGFIDRAGRMVVEPRYLKAYSFSEGLAAVMSQDDAWVYIDTTGKVVSNPEYEYTGAWFTEGLTPAKKGSKWGYVSKEWKFVSLATTRYRSASTKGSPSCVSASRPAT